MYPYNQFNQRQTNVDWIIVQNIDQVNQVIVQPNQKAWIMVQNEPIFALRVADQMGLTMTDLYRFEKIETPSEDHHVYVTKEELEKAIEELKEERYESTSKRTRKPTDSAE